MQRPSTSTNERTPLMAPNYVFESSMTRQYQKRLRNFQCAICVSLMAILGIALLVTVSYDISDALYGPGPDDIEGSTQIPGTLIVDAINKTTANVTIENAPAPAPRLLALSAVAPEIQPLLSLSWPLEEKPPAKWPGSTPTPDALATAVQHGNEALQKRTALEKTRKPLARDTPAGRAQRAAATGAFVKPMADTAYATEQATKALVNGTDTSTREGGVGIGPPTEGLFPQPPYCKAPPPCPPSPYRSIDGTCNNLDHPQLWGVSRIPFRRVLPADYGDGISSPRTSVDGSTLPSARDVSVTVHRPSYAHNSQFTVMLAVWGQFIDHDITATALSKGENSTSLSCCDTSQPPHPECFTVPLDVEDPFYQNYNLTCMEFVRSAPAPKCHFGPREQMNQATAFLDGSTVYGYSKERATNLRSFLGGRLRMFLAAGRELLPPSSDPNDGCNTVEMNAKGRYCFESGDDRANENLHLTTMHLLWARQHNRLATILARLNPDWDDETLYQEARRIVGAQMQHITYSEFLPSILGNDVMWALNLTLQDEGFTYMYNSSVDPSIANHFSAAAFRFAHTLLPGLIRNAELSNGTINYVQLHEMLFNPYQLYLEKGPENAVQSAMFTSVHSVDPHVTSELSNHLFEKPVVVNTTYKKPGPCGLDLVSLNIQRGRDHGLPAYPKWRELCGFPRPTSFEELEGVFDEMSMARIKTIYTNVDNIDLYTGALAEDPKGRLLGPTLTCLIADQFLRLKVGDRFWYETGDPTVGFTIEQLTEIRKTTLAGVICANEDLLDQAQPKVMESISATNPLVDCKELPQPDFNAWKEGNDIEMETAGKWSKSGKGGKYAGGKWGKSGKLKMESVADPAIAEYYKAIGEEYKKKYKEIGDEYAEKAKEIGDEYAKAAKEIEDEFKAKYPNLELPADAEYYKEIGDEYAQEWKDYGAKWAAAGKAIGDEYKSVYAVNNPLEEADPAAAAYYKEIGDEYAKAGKEYGDKWAAAGKAIGDEYKTKFGTKKTPIEQAAASDPAVAAYYKEIGDEYAKAGKEYGDKWAAAGKEIGDEYKSKFGTKKTPIETAATSDPAAAAYYKDVGDKWAAAGKEIGDEYKSKFGTKKTPTEKAAASDPAAAAYYKDVGDKWAAAGKEIGDEYKTKFGTKKTPIETAAASDSAAAAYYKDVGGKWAAAGKEIGNEYKTKFGTKKTPIETAAASDPAAAAYYKDVGDKWAAAGKEIGDEYKTKFGTKKTPIETAAASDPAAAAYYKDVGDKWAATGKEIGDEYKSKFGTKKTPTEKAAASDPAAAAYYKDVGDKWAAAGKEIGDEYKTKFGTKKTPIETAAASDPAAAAYYKDVGDKWAAAGKEIAYYKDVGDKWAAAGKEIGDEYKSKFGTKKTPTEKAAASDPAAAAYYKDVGDKWAAAGKEIGDEYKTKFGTKKTPIETAAASDPAAAAYYKDVGDKWAAAGKEIGDEYKTKFGTKKTPIETAAASDPAAAAYYKDVGDKWAATGKEIGDEYKSKFGTKKTPTEKAAASDPAAAAYYKDVGDKWAAAGKEIGDEYKTKFGTKKTPIETAAASDPAAAAYYKDVGDKWAAAGKEIGNEYKSKFGTKNTPTEKAAASDPAAAAYYKDIGDKWAAAGKEIGDEYKTKFGTKKTPIETAAASDPAAAAYYKDVGDKWAAAGKEIGDEYKSKFGTKNTPTEKAAASDPAAAAYYKDIGDKWAAAGKEIGNEYKSKFGTKKTPIETAAASDPAAAAYYKDIGDKWAAAGKEIGDEYKSKFGTKKTPIETAAASDPAAAAYYKDVGDKWAAAGKEIGDEYKSKFSTKKTPIEKEAASDPAAAAYYKEVGDEYAKAGKDYGDKWAAAGKAIGDQYKNTYAKTKV